MKVIRDVVHGYVELCENDLKIIDTPHFQRLKSIRQNNPFSVYPCANHTRFEHSLGVMHLGVKVFKSLNEKRRRDGEPPFDEKLEATVRYACLLHDVGHAPFSHYGEQFFNKDDLIPLFSSALKKRNVDADLTVGDAGASHEICSCILSLEVYGDILERIGIDFELFCRMIIGEDYPLGSEKIENTLIDILNSNTDVDKLDYVLRDSQMSGANLVALDVDRLVSAYMTYNGEIAFSGKSLSTIAGLIYGREAVYTWIVNHHVNVYTGCVLTKIMKRAFDSDAEKDSFFSYPAIAKRLVDDYDVISRIRSKLQNGDAELDSLYQQLSSRQYYKPIWKNHMEFKSCITNQSNQDRFKNLVGGNLQDPEQIEKIVADKIGVEQGDLIISVADYKPFVPFIMRRGSTKTNPVYIIINDDAVSFQDIFKTSIYHERESELPLVFVKGTEQKDKFLEEYNRVIS